MAHQILAFANEFGEPAGDQAVLIPLRLTQGDLAGMVGASRIRVNETMVAYKRQRLFSVDRHYQITVLDPSALARKCQAFQIG